MAHDDPHTADGTDAAEAVTDLSETLDTEHQLMRHIVLDITIAVPIADLGVAVGMIALALSIDGEALEAPILIAVAFGVLAGVFFGTWAGFVSTAHVRGPRPHAGTHTPALTCSSVDRDTVHRVARARRSSTS